jgi:hypothetical protein
MMWSYLSDSSESIATYLFYVQMAQGERLRGEQVDARLRLLLTDAKENNYQWRGGRKPVDFIFLRISLKIESTGPIADIERKAGALYREKSVMRGM